MTEANRRTIRTALQVLVGLAAAMPLLVHEAGLDASAWPWLGVVLAVAAAVTRIMHLPEVDALLRRIGLGLATHDEPTETTHGER